MRSGGGSFIRSMGGNFNSNIEDDEVNIFYGLGRTENVFPAPALFLKSWYNYDGAWTQKADFAYLAAYGPSVRYLNKIYYGLGADYTNPLSLIPTTDWYEYNIDTDTWTQLTSFPGVTRVWSTAAAWNGKIYVIAGWKQVIGLPGTWLTDCYVYDIAGDSWSSIAAWPDALGRYQAISFAYNNKIYVGMGQRGTSGIVGTWYAYDISSGTWGSLLTTCPQVGTEVSGGIIDDNIYIGNGAGSTYFGYNNWYKYNITTNTWTAIAQMGANTPYHIGGFGVEYGGYIYAGLGYYSPFDQVNNDLWKYNPSSDSWVLYSNAPIKSAFGAGG